MDPFEVTRIAACDCSIALLNQDMPCFVKWKNETSSKVFSRAERNEIVMMTRCELARGGACDIASWYDEISVAVLGT